ncbi:MAG: dicarboxylate/amino acid:cation symporter [Alphaproteobacteria bacterium]|nr:dicarboxylate/amino acid:cation symporter [Alphaproteobacteria bacterium]
MKLWHQVLIGLAAGIVFGLVFKEDAAIVKPIGTVFINMILMCVVPLIFFSLISGITGMKDPKALGRVGFKSTFAYLTTVAFAIVIGLVVVNVLHPGVGVDLKLDQAALAAKPATQQQSIIDTFVNIVPKNAIGAMAEGHILQVVFFAIFVGISLTLMGKDGEKLVDLAHVSAKLMFKIIGYVVRLSPFGVFALIATVVGTQGVEVIYSLIKLVVTVVIACGIQYVVFGLLIFFFARMSPFPFYKKSLDYQALAFSTSSSKATLPTTMTVLADKMGVSRDSTSFVLPLGASINMDGTALYMGICAVFIAQATGVVLSPHDYFILIFTCTIGSIGAAGYPGGAMAMMGVVLSALNLPIEGLALILGVDRILDMLRTTINITGDATITLIIDKSEGKLDEKAYHA